MVVVGALYSLLDGFSITSTDIMFDDGGTGEVSNTGSKDTRVFLKNVIQWLTLVGQKVTVGKAVR